MPAPQINRPSVHSLQPTLKTPSTSTITPASLYDGEKLTNQNSFKRIYKNPQVAKNNSNIINKGGYL